MNVQFTRTEILTLMGELPETHWTQARLMEALIGTTNMVHTPETATQEQFTVQTPALQEQCVWKNFGFPCRNEVTTVNDAGEPTCKTHAHPVCVNDGKPATHNCQHPYQFVCGNLLCENCEGCNIHRTGH